MSTTKYHAAKISPSGGDVAAGDRRGAFPMWRPCRGSPSRAKLVPGLHIKGLSNKSPDRCRRRGFMVLPPTGGIINSLPLKGKRLTTFCASLTLLQNVFAVHRKAAIHNPRPERPSKLRTLRPIGPGHLKNLFHNLFHNLFLQPFYTTRGGAAPPFLQNLRRQPPPQPSGPKAPSNLRTLRPIGPVNPKNLPL